MTRIEVVRPRRQVALLEVDAEIARRLAAFDDRVPGRTRVDCFIAVEWVNFPLAAPCRVCRVSRSACSTLKKAGESPSDDFFGEALLANRFFDIWTRSRCRYGTPRVTAALWQQGKQVGEKRVAWRMAEIGIVGICGRKKVKTTRCDPDHELSFDLVERDFTADAPDELWLTDVIDIPTDEGWLYLCSILDVSNRGLLGWSLGDSLRTGFCTNALDAFCHTDPLLPVACAHRSLP